MSFLSEWHVAPIYKVIPSVYAFNVAISPVSCWFRLSYLLFSSLLSVYAVPDAWCLWAGPRLAYCYGLMWVTISFLRGMNKTIRTLQVIPQTIWR